MAVVRATLLTAFALGLTACSIGSSHAGSSGQHRARPQPTATVTVTAAVTATATVTVTASPTTVVPLTPPCTNAALFNAAARKDHLDPHGPGYGHGNPPTASGAECDDGWAVAEVNRPYTGSTDAGALFHVIDEQWTEVATEVVPVRCVLLADGVPTAVAKDLTPPPTSVDRNFCP